MSFKVLCESGGEDCCVHRAESQEAVTRWLDIVLYAVTRGRFSLMSELNEIQSACNDDEMERFPNKFTIPLMIVNLVLQPYGLWIKGSSEVCEKIIGDFGQSTSPGLIAI